MTGGFTLIEMVVVCAIVGMVAAVALPQLMPAIVYGKLEGAARHLAGYGRAAMANATVLRNNLVITVDLKNQRYATVRIVEAEPESGQLFDKKKSDEPEPDIAELLRREKQPSQEELEEAGAAMSNRFDNYIKAQMTARANMIKKDGILKDIGPLFDKKFSLDTKTQESTEQPVDDPMLEPTTLPADVVIESIRVGGKLFSEGEVKLELSAMGLKEPVFFLLRNEDSDYYTVIWDPITSSVRMERGRTAADEADPGTA